MDTLPPEILHNILKPENHCSAGVPFGPTIKESYLKLRLVCRTFSEIIAPHAFANICIVDGECSLDRLSAIAKRANLSGLVKSYLFRFNEPRMIAPSTKKDYLKIISLPKERYTEALQSHTESCRNQIAYLSKVLTFQTSGDLERVHVQLLSESFPNLTTLGITAQPAQMFSDILPNVNILTSNGTNSNWGPLVFRAYLNALVKRTESTASDLKPITTFSIQGLSEDCLILSSDFLDYVAAGLKPIREFNFSMSITQSMHDGATPSWLHPVGKILRSSSDLRTLNLSTTSNLLVHFSALVAPPIKPLVIHHWASLEKLILKNVFVPRDLFKRFLTIHKRTLSHITIHLCDILDHSRMSPHAAAASTDGETPHPEPWTDIFRHMRATNRPRLTALSLMHLSDGKTAHEHHLRQTFVREWQDWITHAEKLQEPVENAESCDLNGEDEWCQECMRQSYESDSDDDGVFGFGYPPQWGWEGDDDMDEDDEDDDDDDDEDDDDIEYALHHHHHHHHGLMLHPTFHSDW